MAETHRTLFDFAEGKSELVSGFNIEYTDSISVFAVIFVPYYIHIILMRFITSSSISLS